MITSTVTICIAKLEKFMAIWDQRAAFIADRAVRLTNSSQLRCIRPSDAVDLIVSIPEIASIRMACFCCASRKVSCTIRFIGICISMPMGMTMQTTTAGTIATGPPMT